MRAVVEATATTALLVLMELGQHQSETCNQPAGHPLRVNLRNQVRSGRVGVAAKLSEMVQAAGVALADVEGHLAVVAKVEAEALPLPC